MDILAPLGRLAYLYVGSARFAETLQYYRDLLGAPVLWHFARGGVRVAAVQLGAGPPLVLADHRPSPGMMPIFSVADLAGAVEALRVRGWRPTSGPVELPDGPCYLFHDPSGNELGLMGEVRPGLLEQAWADPGNPDAVR